MWRIVVAVLPSACGVVCGLFPLVVVFWHPRAACDERGVRLAAVPFGITALAMM